MPGHSADIVCLECYQAPSSLPPPPQPPSLSLCLSNPPPAQRAMTCSRKRARMSEVSTVAKLASFASSVTGRTWCSDYGRCFEVREKERGCREQEHEFRDIPEKQRGFREKNADFVKKTRISRKKNEFGEKERRCRRCRQSPSWQASPRLTQAAPVCSLELGGLGSGFRV